MIFYRITFEVDGEQYSDFDCTETEDLTQVEKEHERKIRLRAYWPLDYALTSIETISKTELKREILDRKDLVEGMISDCERDSSFADEEYLYEIEERKKQLKEMELLLEQNTPNSQ